MVHRILFGFLLSGFVLASQASAKPIIGPKCSLDPATWPQLQARAKAGDEKALRFIAISSHSMVQNAAIANLSVAEEEQVFTRFMFEEGDTPESFSLKLKHLKGLMSELTNMTLKGATTTDEMNWLRQQFGLKARTTPYDDNWCAHQPRGAA